MTRAFALSVTLALVARYETGARRKRVMNAYARGRADHRRGRHFNASGTYGGNFNEPLRQAYRHGWHSWRGDR